MVKALLSKDELLKQLQRDLGKAREFRLATALVISNMAF